MATDKKWRGIFIIPPTPFHEDLEIDYDGLRRIVRFALDCGAHGLVASANASESGYLTEDERTRVLATIIDECGRSVPVIAGVSSSCSRISIRYARAAEAEGADAIMAMPPTLQKPSESETRDYFERLSASTALPIVVQNWAGPGGTPMSAKFVSSIVRDFPNCRFVKEETEFSSVVISEIRTLTEGLDVAIMGGKSGRHLIDEYHRGVIGTMPACEIPDIQVALWNSLESGEQDRAFEIYEKMTPFLTFEMGYNAVMYKTILKRRGIIQSIAVRQTGGRRLDARSTEYLNLLLGRLAPYMDPRYPVRAAE